MAVDIKVGQTLGIRSDINNWMIIQTKTMGADSKKAGNKYEKILGSYPFLSTCLDAILERDLEDSDAKSIAALRKEVGALKAEIKKIGAALCH